MRIRSILQKGLRRLIEADDGSGLQPAVVPKLRRTVSFLQDMQREDELHDIPVGKPIASAGIGKAHGASS